MHTITSLRKTLNLSTTNQVRNRIEAIKDVLAEHLRRGPNNQILLTDEGVERLRDLQELYDSGLTMSEASDVVRANVYRKAGPAPAAGHAFARDQAIPRETVSRVALDVRDELAQLRERIAFLEGRLEALSRTPERSEATWWERLREDVDAP